MKTLKEGLVESILMVEEYLKIVEASDGSIDMIIILESGKVTSIHNILFALNNDTKGGNKY